MSNAQMTTIYFDGLCHLCSREINHYKKKVTTEPIQFVDIMASDFNPSQEGLDPLAIHKTMHVREGEKLFTGVDAFLAIWRVVPGYSWLRKAISLPGCYQLAKLGYAVFARIRPLLPKRKSSECLTDHCVK